MKKLEKKLFEKQIEPKIFFKFDCNEIVSIIGGLAISNNGICTLYFKTIMV